MGCRSDQIEPGLYFSCSASAMVNGPPAMSLWIPWCKYPWSGPTKEFLKHWNLKVGRTLCRLIMRADMPLLHQYEVFVSWENPPSEGWLPIEAAALERTDSDQKMALLCSTIPYSPAPQNSTMYCIHRTKPGTTMCYRPVVGRPLYHAWFLACKAHVKHAKVLKNTISILVSVED